MTLKQSTTNLVFVFALFLSNSLFGQFQINAVLSEPDSNSTNLQLTVCDFTDMVSMQFSINYNPDLVTYTASTDHNLAGLGPANIANPSPGKITLSWVADDVFNGESVANCTSIVTLLFDGAGTTNDNYAFTSDPTVIEVSDVNGLVSPVLAVADCACGNSGLAQFELEGREITVFPNPMSANAQIEIMGETIQNGTCRMFNIVGQEVYTQLFSGNKLTIESNKLLAGTYFTAIYSDGVLIGVEKVIVK